MTPERTTWLTPADYLASFRADGERLSTLARDGDLAAPVPSCPGWALRDLLRHCADVYAHKVATLQRGRRAQPGQWPLADDLDGAELVDWHDERVAELSGLLGELGPAVECWTWFPGEGRTAFWFRRMAHEALVHRVDGELAVGAADAGHGDGRLAVDGVHEVLTWFAGDPDVLGDSRADVGAAGSVLVEAGGTRLVVDLPDGGLQVRPAATDAHEQARLAGDPMALDLHLWGRSVRDVQAEGDERVLERLHARLGLAVG